jgi:sugar lactone lactonase YvrE
MFRSVFLLVVMAALSLTGLSSLTAAQDTSTVLAKGLNNPRHITFGSDGSLYIAEAGAGGNLDGKGPYSDVKYGETGQISMVSPDGEQTVVLSGLVSMDSGFGRIDGATALYVTDDSYWVTLGVGVSDLPKGQYVDALVQYGRDDLEVKQAVNLATFEKANNPDQNPDDLVSNPTDLAVAPDGTIYLADASANAVLTWTASGGLTLFAAWPVHENEAAAVPTSVTLDKNGDVYVGFLTGFPFQPQTARIEVYTPDGKLQKTYDKLSFVTDVLVMDDGTIYASQFSSGFGDQGWAGHSGSVVMVSDDGITPIAEDLNFPYGIALTPDGKLAVSVDTFGMPPDSGRVIALDMKPAS